MVVGEEVETGADDQFDLGPTVFGNIDGLGQPLEPIAQQPLEDLVVQRLFDGKWWSRLGRRIPTPAAMSLSEVPSYPDFGKAVQGLVDDQVAGRQLLDHGVPHVGQCKRFFPERLPTGR